MMENWTNDVGETEMLFKSINGIRLATTGKHTRTIADAVAVALRISDEAPLETLSAP